MNIYNINIFLILKLKCLFILIVLRCLHGKERDTKLLIVALCKVSLLALRLSFAFVGRCSSRQSGLRYIHICTFVPHLTYGCAVYLHLFSYGRTVGIWSDFFSLFYSPSYNDFAYMQALIIVLFMNKDVLRIKLKCTEMKQIK